MHRALLPCDTVPCEKLVLSNRLFYRVMIVTLLTTMIVSAATTGWGANAIWVGAGPIPVIQDPENWLGELRPGPNDTAHFLELTSGAYSVVFDGSSGVTDAVKIASIEGPSVHFKGNSANLDLRFTIFGSGGDGLFSDLSVGGGGTLRISSMEFKSEGGARVHGGSTITLQSVNVHFPKKPKLTISGAAGFQVDGILNVLTKSTVNSTNSYIGRFQGSTGSGLVRDISSVWNSSDQMFVGVNGDATLRVEAAAEVNNARGYIGRNPNSTSEATITGFDFFRGSKWNNSTSLFLGGNNIVDGGVGTLNIESKGQVNVGNNLFTGTGTALTVSGSGASGNLWVRHGSKIYNSGIGHIGLSSGSTGTATVTGINSHWENLSNLEVGSSGNGTLNIKAGGLVSNRNGLVGLRAGSTGLVTVTGNGSNWNNVEGLLLGGNATVDGGVGTLNIEDDGQVNVGNTPSSLAGVALIVSDSGANGNLFVRNGSKINNLGFGTIGLNLGSSGTATVLGDGSHWENSTFLNVGSRGNGMLNVEAGGLVTNTAGVIGRIGDSNGTATVTGIGSHWNNSLYLNVGQDGNGTLNVEADGLVSNTFANISRNAGSTGAATVTGSGSHWNNSSYLNVGRSGIGTLKVEASGLVSNTFANISRNAGSTGTATVTGTGSRWNSSDSLYVGGTVSSAGGTGTLNIQDNGLVDVTNTLKIWGGGTVNLDGGVVRVGTFDHTSAGTFNFNDGELIIDEGAFNRVASNLIIDGNSPADHATVTFINSTTSSAIPILMVGQNAHGSLNIEAGGVIGNATGEVGRNLGSTGAATVTGSGSRWDNSSYLVVGRHGNGTLKVEAGGRVTNTDGNVGRDATSTSTAMVTGNGSRWDNSSSLKVGFAGQGRLDIEAGGQVTNTEGTLGLQSGSTGTAMVSGAGSKWNNSSFLKVGDNGQGALSVKASGQVTNTNGFLGLGSGATGAATVTGDGSRWNNSHGLFLGGTATGNGGVGTLNIESDGKVNVGFDIYTGNTAALTVGDVGANGVLWVRNGSTINNSGVGIIGLNSFSTGTATVTGSGSQWNNGVSLRVGSLGDGTLNIEAGGRVSNPTGFIGYASGSTSRVTVTGSGSKWNNSNLMYVGLAGDGTLIVEAGGQVINTDGNIGASSSSTALATVTGPGSHWNNTGGLNVGGDFFNAGGTGTLNVQDNGLVNVTNTLKIWGAGTVNLDGGTLRAGTLDPTAGTFNWTAGRLNVDHHVGNLTQNAGTLVLGNSPGTTVIAGDYTLNSGGTLEIELMGDGGVAGADFDLLDITGSTTLGGTLDVLLIDSFQPSAGDSFDILTAVSILGEFDAINFPTLTNGLQWFINYNTTSIELVATYGADFDEDGDVDGNDLAAWESGFGNSPAKHNDGDANANALATGFDFLAWQQQFSPDTPALASSQIVPEPKSIAMLVLAFVLVIAKRHH